MRQTDQTPQEIIDQLGQDPFTQLMQELQDEKDLHTPFHSITEVYNSLHEALRDLRRDVVANAPIDEILDDIFILAAIAVFGRWDLMK